MTNWKKEYPDKVKKMSNDDLFSEYTYLCGGDGYDGCMTSDGDFRYKLINNELLKRLSNPNFLFLSEKYVKDYTI